MTTGPGIEPGEVVMTAGTVEALPWRTPALFRFRVLIFTLLYLIGFYAPWSRYVSTGPVSTTWITLSAWLARTGLLDYAKATVTVTVAAILFALLGAYFRLWATAYIGAGVMNDKSLRADHIVASGPYRYLRNPLYLGNLLTCVAVSILMPPTGAIVFLAGCVLLTLALVAAEGPHLARQLGAAYDTYRRQIPSFIPAIRAHVPPAPVKARWGQALAAESFHVGYALCLVVFAWQYNVDLLIRCLLICFGISLVANGIFSTRTLRPVTSPPL
jgi:protein-S-isoprenylcysteine O-methyltransferase Ste14